MGAQLSKKQEAESKRIWKGLRFFIEGQYSAGKTGLILRLAQGEFVPTSHSLGDYIKKLSFDGIEINGWEIGGRHKIRSIRRNLYKRTDAIVYVIDSADADRLDDALDELTTYILKEESLEDRVVMVLANKQDLENALGPEEIEAKLLEKCENTIGFNMTVFVMPCSVLSGEGITEAFCKFAKMVTDKNNQGIVPSGFIPQAWLSHPDDKKSKLKEEENSKAQLSVQDDGQLKLTEDEKPKAQLSVQEDEEPKSNDDKTSQEQNDQVYSGKIQSELLLNNLILNEVSDNKNVIDFSKSEKNEPKDWHKIKKWVKDPFTSFKSVLFY